MVSSSIQPFGHNRHGPKIGGCAPLGGAGSPCITKSLGPTSTSLSTFVPSGILIHQAVWPKQTWTGCFPFWWGGAGSPSKTMWPGPRPTSMPSLFEPFGHNLHQRYRQNRTDRQRSDSIGRTVLQTVAQKQKYDSNEIMSRPCCRNAPLILQFLLSEIMKYATRILVCVIAVSKSQ